MYSPRILANALERLKNTHALPSPRRICVAYSGGLDSQVLLHSLNKIKHLSLFVNVKFLSFHVNHGLQTKSFEWEEACRHQCDQLNIPYLSQQVSVESGPGISVEEAARDARYAAISAAAQAGDWWLTAHHLDDQAETIWLQLMRGAGMGGMAAMPDAQKLHSAWLLRPLLDVARDDIKKYAEQCGLTWIEDPSNQDLRFDRNFLRHRILPTLSMRWPGWSKTLTRSAQLVAEGDALAREVACEDIENTREDSFDILNIGRLCRLSVTRQRNLLAHWAEGLGLPTPHRVHVDQILQNVVSAKEDAMPLLRWPGAEVRRYSGRLYLMRPVSEATTSSSGVAWDGQSSLDFPGIGQLESQRMIGQGVADRGRDTIYAVRFRHGGESLRLAHRGGRHTLKNLFQEARVPPWVRNRLPLVFCGDELVYVPGIGIAQGYGAEPGEPGWVWLWRPESR